MMKDDEFDEFDEIDPLDVIRDFTEMSECIIINSIALLNLYYEFDWFPSDSWYNESADSIVYTFIPTGDADAISLEVAVQDFSTTAVFDIALEDLANMIGVSSGSISICKH